MLHVSTTTFNRPSNVTPYNAFTVIAPSTPAPLIFPVINPRGIIRQINIATNNSASISNSYRLYLFDASFTAIADQGASGFTGNMAFDFITQAVIVNVVTTGGSAVSYSVTPAQPLPYLTPNNTLYGLLRTEEAFTPIASQNFQVSLFVDTNNNNFNI